MGSLPDYSFTISVPGHGPDYFAVVLRPTHDGMVQAMTQAGDTPDVAGLQACCQTVSCADLPDLRGILFFSLDAMGSGVVSHELAHAAFRLLDHHGIRVRHYDHGDEPLTTHATEELYCELLEGLVKAFWRGYYEGNYGGTHG